jgi:hypothetical protein
MVTALPGSGCPSETSELKGSTGATIQDRHAAGCDGSRGWTATSCKASGHRSQ